MMNLDSIIGQGDKNNPNDAAAWGTEAVAAYQQQKLPEQNVYSIPSADKFLPSFGINMNEQWNNPEHRLTSKFEKSQADKAVAALEKGDFSSVQSAIKEAVEQDLSLGLTLHEIKKQTGVEVLYTNENGMSVTHRTTDKKGRELDVISLSVNADGTVTVGDYKKGGQPQPLPTVEEATKMIMEKASTYKSGGGGGGNGFSGSALKAIGNQIENGNAVKGIVDQFPKEENKDESPISANANALETNPGDIVKGLIEETEPGNIVKGIAGAVEQADLAKGLMYKAAEALKLRRRME
jgi:hypothetical protein